jgi:hypothetical protein
MQQQRRQNYRPRITLYFSYYLRYNMTRDLNFNYYLFVSVQPDELPYSVGMTKWDEGVSLLVTAFLRKFLANLVPNLMKVFVLCSTQWANNYVTSPNTSTCTSPTAGKEIHLLTYSGSNFNNNITASFQQQHLSSYSTSSEFLSESSPDDSLGDFEGTKFLTYMTGYRVSP